MFFVWSSAHAAAVATGARMDDKMGYFRFVLDLTEVGEYEVFTLQNPPRMVIDLVNAKWNGPKGDLEKMKGKYIDGVRYGHPDMGILRVVLDAKMPLGIKKKFIIKPKGEGANKTYRLVIDVSPDTSAPPVVEEAKAPASQTPASMQQEEEKPQEQPQEPPLSLERLQDDSPVPDKEIPESITKEKPESNLPASMRGEEPVQQDPQNYVKEEPVPELKNVPKMPKQRVEEKKPEPGKPLSMTSLYSEKKKIRGEKPVIVIDAGHGGIDPGASGKSGVKEKDITLRYATDMKEQLEKSGKYKVVMTRKGDYFVNLRDRVEIAKESSGDLFISVHADSHPDPRTRGLSVYTLSEKASDKEAEALAERANDEDVIDGVDLKKESEDLQGLLIDMVQRDTKNHSAEFAQLLVESLGKDARLLENSHRFAGFVVLTGADVPSVLVELGYLSNKIEDKLLQTPEYRMKIIEAMSETVDSYFVKNDF